MEKKKYYYIDFIRIFSMLSVIMLHVCADVLWAGKIDGVWHFSNILSALCSASVPLFFMISGAMLLSDEKNKEPGFAVYAMAQLYMILGVIHEKSAETNQPRHFLDAISFINANYKNSDLSIDMICAGSGINATVFRQLFNQYYQKTPIQYITELRLEYARNLISTGTPIENAAYESGFNDSKYFARVVKKHFGCTPRELKNYGK